MQIITLSAGANKLSKIQEQAEEYAALIMEELDPSNLGYIEVSFTTFSDIFFLIKFFKQWFGSGELRLSSPMFNHPQ